MLEQFGDSWVEVERVVYVGPICVGTLPGGQLWYGFEVSIENGHSYKPRYRVKENAIKRRDYLIMTKSEISKSESLEGEEKWK